MDIWRVFLKKKKKKWNMIINNTKSGSIRSFCACLSSIMQMFTLHELFPYFICVTWEVWITFCIVFSIITQQKDWIVPFRCGRVFVVIIQSVMSSKLQLIWSAFKVDKVLGIVLLSMEQWKKKQSSGCLNLRWLPVVSAVSVLFPVLLFIHLTVIKLFSCWLK